MRIYGPNGTTKTASASAARRTVSGGFTISEPEVPRPGGSVMSLRQIGGVDALLALQGVEEPKERRRRAVRRGRQALDVLDEIRVGLLSGRLDGTMLLRLKSAASGLKDLSGDEGLDRVMAEIDLRVEVELAKAGIR
jgi:hypothetical protein